MIYQLIGLGASLIALLSAIFLYWRIARIPIANGAVREISNAIKEGAMSFLKREYKFLSFFVLVVAILLGIFLSWILSVAFILGALLSIIAGNVGMRVATLANARTAEASQKGLKQGLKVAFNSGSVMGFSVVGLGLAGVTILLWILKDPNLIFGFGFGASSVALFARVGGGIYTKAADVGADLVGKVEAGIPEDDPRNPASIADNVGDNVGDVAGMGADLFESYVQSIIAAMVIGLGISFVTGLSAVFLPIILAASGIIASLIGTAFVKIGNFSAHRHLNNGIWSATIIAAAFAGFIIWYFTKDLGIFWSYLAGLLAGVAIGLITEYYTSYDHKPAQKISKSSLISAATNILDGFSLGLKSTFWPIIVIAVAIWLAFHFGGLYGIAIAAVGMLSTLGITLATDTYGPVADNAAGIAEMAHLGEQTRRTAEDLDAVGNTTAAIGKGFAIGSAALTALVLLVSYGQVVGLEVVNLFSVNVLIGLFIGGMLPFVFSSMTISAVSKAAGEMVEEVRRQFREIPGIMEGTTRPDYEKTVAISTTSALKEMVLPGVLAIVAPVVMGFILGTSALAGLLAGSLVSGFLLAVTMANSGGAWDNAKKYIEAGNFGGKGSAAHKAAVVGDTVGDPFKDTSGPSLNILLKLMAIVALIIAPLL